MPPSAALEAGANAGPSVGRSRSASPSRAALTERKACTMTDGGAWGVGARPPRTSRAGRGAAGSRAATRASRP